MILTSYHSFVDFVPFLALAFALHRGYRSGCSISSPRKHWCEHTAAFDSCNRLQVISAVRSLQPCKNFLPLLTTKATKDHGGSTMVGVVNEAMKAAL
jgi:hypothetical protein